jgi:hypothetical protein
LMDETVCWQSALYTIVCWDLVPGIEKETWH